MQFTAKYEKNEYSFCGGGYIKLLPASLDPKEFNGDSEYAIMFGPDRCGYDVSRIHAIFNHDGKNLLKKDDIKLEYNDKNEFTHLYTLIVHPDNTYEVLMDQTSKSKGSLYDHWAFQPKQIDDPTDKKPSDWVDEAKIPDTTDVKVRGGSSASGSVLFYCAVSCVLSCVPCVGVRGAQGRHGVVTNHPRVAVLPRACHVATLFFRCGLCRCRRRATLKPGRVFAVLLACFIVVRV